MFDIAVLSKQTENIENFHEGDVIFHDGEESNGNMYVVLEGSVGVYKNYEEPGEICIVDLPVGEFFGEMALFLGMGRTATIVAKNDVKLYRFDRKSTLDFINCEPETTFAFMQALCTKISTANTTSATVSNEKHTIKTLANKDPLTGTNNRRYFMEAAAYQIETAAIRDEKIFIAIFDLDYFKKVNDTYGHQAGDFVLQSFATMVTDSVRSDDIFARYGGEEFILLAECNNLGDAEFFIDRLRQHTCDLEILFEDSHIPVSTSIGVVEVTPGLDVEAAIALADIALYQAKKRGRNRTIFYEEGMEL